MTKIWNFKQIAFGRKMFACVLFSFTNRNTLAYWLKMIFWRDSKLVELIIEWAINKYYILNQMCTFLKHWINITKSQCEIRKKNNHTSLGMITWLWKPERDRQGCMTPPTPRTLRFVYTFLEYIVANIMKSFRVHLYH